MNRIYLNGLVALAVLAGAQGAHALAAGQETAAMARVDYVEGGIGEDERAAMLGVRDQYNLQLVFASGRSGEYRADVDVEITDAQGNVRFKASQAGPLLYVRLPQGRYQVAAHALGQRQARPLVLREGGRREMVFYWKQD